MTRDELQDLFAKRGTNWINHWSSDASIELDGQFDVDDLKILIEYLEGLT